jgi:hypothetical protein
MGLSTLAPVPPLGPLLAHPSLYPPPTRSALFLGGVHTSQFPYPPRIGGCSCTPPSKARVGARRNTPTRCMGRRRARAGGMEESTAERARVGMPSPVLRQPQGRGRRAAVPPSAPGGGHFCFLSGARATSRPSTSVRVPTSGTSRLGGEIPAGGETEGSLTWRRTRCVRSCPAGRMYRGGPSWPCSWCGARTCG